MQNTTITLTTINSKTDTNFQPVMIFVENSLSHPASNKIASHDGRVAGYMSEMEFTD